MNAPSDAQEILASYEDSERFGTVIRRHFPEIFRYLSRRVGPEATDLAAETFVVAFRSRRRYDLGRSDATPWLYGIATNLVRRHRRSEARQLAAYSKLAVEPAGDGDATPDVIAQLDAQRDLVRAAKAFAKLDDDQRDALYLVAVCGLAYEAAADALGLKAGTLHSRIARARKRLRDLMECNDEELMRDRTPDRDERS